MRRSIPPFLRLAVVCALRARSCFPETSSEKDAPSSVVVSNAHESVAS